MNTPRDGFHRAGFRAAGTLRRQRPLALTLLLAMVATAAPAPLASQSAFAQQVPVQRIAAVVNDKIISLRDVQERLMLTMLTAGMNDSPENRKRMVPRVVRALIDDSIKLQEAERLKITVTDADVQRARQQIESNNKMPPGGLDDMLRRSGVNPKELEAQLKAEVAWIKVVQSSLRRQASVQPEEVDAALNQLRMVQGKPERLLAEIVLPVDSADQEEQVRAFAEKIVEQVRGGGNFAALAGQFSAVATAAKGGDLGWVPQGQLDPEVEPTVDALSPGQVSDPIRTSTGFSIMMLRERRETRAPSPDQQPVTLSQLYMPTSGRAAMPVSSRNDLEQTLRQGGASSCADVDRIAGEMRLPSSGPIGTLPLDQLPPPVQAVVRTLPENQLSQRIAISGAEVMVMVCNRPDGAGLPSREQLEQQLEQEKLDRISQRTLRDLRRAALIDIRL